MVHRMTRPRLRWSSLSVLLFVTMLGISCNPQRSAPTQQRPDRISLETVASETLWTPEEIATLRSLWIGSLPPLPPDPSNSVADDPRAASLGQKIYFDTRFSVNGEISCATCHQPDLLFTDGLPRAEAIGTTPRGAPTIVGSAYSPWFFWDGRRDSQWAQALTPLESPIEHGGTRTQYVHILDEDEIYRAEYEAIFGGLPDFSDRTRFPDMAGPVEDSEARAAWEAMTSVDRQAVSRAYANMGKAIAAYERLIMPGPSGFDRYVQALLEGDEEAMQSALTPDEVAGLRLFIGLGNCIRCHNGPLFTNNGFHNIGVPTAEGLPLDMGRIRGVQEVISSEFNCLGQYSDAGPDDCAELRFVKTLGQELPGAFKVPTLRNVAETAPYMHSGQFATLQEVLNHYNQLPAAPIGHSELTPINFSDSELAQLEAFLRSLSGPLATDPTILAPPQ
jgi:cytochrome c peroxidase